MATKDERPGLLSKVAMFVRNPTKDWSELDQVEARAAAPQESAQDRQALKDMIERKRQNDFIRKREFDQLRKLRNRAPGAPAAAARPSFFQSSLPMEEEGRSVTLKKIDEIEAQMSKQWWKGKQANATPSEKLAAQAAPEHATPATEEAPDDKAQVSASQLPFATTQLMTQPGVTADAASDFASTQTVSDLMKVEVARNQEMVAVRQAEPNFGFALSIPAAMDESVLEPDAELEEAAIRYANGDDVGAEQCLLAALRTPLPEQRNMRTQVEALLDFYRTKGKRESFESATREFAACLQGRAMPWELAMSALAVPLAGPAGLKQSHAVAASQAGASALPTLTWQCPATLSEATLEMLRDVLLESPQPWTLDWTALQHIAPDAVALLDDFFASLCEESLELRFFGSDRLVQTLRTFVASGDRAVDDVWWQVRLNVLRVLSMQDDFELAALDYCVNLGVAPPVWQAAQCDCQEMSAAERAAYAPPAPPAPTEPEQGPTASAPTHALATPKPGASSQASPLQLQGELLGDASPALALLDAAMGEQTVLQVQCDTLLRVDFAAAGSLLNWMAIRQAEGKQVQLLNVNRLVAAFFGVIGIHETAKVVLRAV